MSEAVVRHLFLPVNPEPWTSPTSSTGRKGGRVVAFSHKNARLRAYQAMIREEVEAFHDHVPFAESVQVEFYFWRALEQYEVNGKLRRRHAADATNLQKALEDALQGLLFTNDRNVTRIMSQMVEQGPDVEPGIVIKVTSGITTDAPASIVSRRLAGAGCSYGEMKHDW